VTAPILVVEDEEIVREAIRQLLESEGYRVFDTPHGAIAMRLLHEHPIDLVITDLLMPEQEGLETILQIRQLWPELKIIAISGGGRFGLTNFLDVAKRFGADRTFAKPFDRQELLAAVRELLAGGES
jgi:CheY-like chemotaxis protein